MRVASIYLILILFTSCSPFGKAPDVITQQVKHDTDDPAIWYNERNPANSIIFGTDKNEDGAIYAFDLSGKIIEEKGIPNIKRPNNIDVEYKVPWDSSTIDILAFTERDRQQVRIFSVPDMRPMDNGGFKVFEGEPEGDFSAPMGIGIFKHKRTYETYIIVSRKNGPTNGSYLWQYRIRQEGHVFDFHLVRKFGKFSGKAEIEAIAVDDALGYVYYSDEGAGIRKYWANPPGGDEELAFFGRDHFKEDMEGIAIVQGEGQTGVIVVSDQQAGTINVFDRLNGHQFLRSIPFQARETDGLEALSNPLPGFPFGILVAMTEGKQFHYYELNELLNH